MKMPLSLANTLVRLIDGPNRPPSFETLCMLEPGLALVEASARFYTQLTGPISPSKVWFGFQGGHGLKERITNLVGPDSGAEGVLGTPEALEVATNHILNILLSCRACPKRQ